MATANEQIADAATTHAVNILRVEASLRQSVLAELKRLEATIIAEIAGLPESATQFYKARLNALLGQTTKAINATYEVIAEAQGKSLAKVAGLEQKQTNQILDNTFGVEVATVAQTPSQLETMVDEQLLEGAVQKDWWDKQSSDLQNKFTLAMRDGMSRGEGIDSLVRRVHGTKAANYSDGIMQTTRAQAEALVRTSVQSAANGARIRSFMKNLDLIKALQWRATLDKRTSQICIALDGKMWSLPGFEAIGHDIEFPGPIAHWNCRSVQVPVTRSWAELSGPKGVRPPGPVPPQSVEKLFRDKLKKAGMSEGQIEAAVKEKRLAFDGEAAAPVSMDEFLKAKDSDFQNKLLGPHRAQLWREGKIKLADLVDQTGRPLTIDQLHSMITANEAVKAHPPKEKDNGLTIAERKLLEESLIEGSQVKAILTHFMDKTTAERITITGLSPSFGDLALVAKMKEVEILRNGLSDGEIFTPQEIGLYGKLPNFAQARIVTPNGRMTTLTLKKGRVFDSAAAAAVNQKTQQGLGAGKGLLNATAAAVRQQGSLKVSTQPVGSVVPTKEAFVQTFGALSVPQPFAGPTPSGVAFRSTQAIAASVQNPTAKNLAVLLNQNAVLAEPAMTKVMVELAEKHGGAPAGLDFAVKSIRSNERKILDDVQKQEISLPTAAARLGDTVRYTMVFPDKIFAQSAQATLDDLRKRGFQVLQVKDFWADPHYHGTHVFMRDPDAGLVMELQFHTPESYRIKEGDSHPIYEEFRELKDSDARQAELGAQLVEVWKDVVVPTNATSIHDPAGPPQAVRITTENINAYKGDADVSALAAHKDDLQGAFKITGDSSVVPLSSLVSLKNELADKRFMLGLKNDPRINAQKGMLAAIEGEGYKRAPLEVIDNGDGTYTIVDGNATAQVAMLAGWTKAVVRIRPKSGGPVIIAPKATSKATLDALRAGIIEEFKPAALRKAQDAVNAAMLRLSGMRGNDPDEPVYAAAYKVFKAAQAARDKIDATSVGALERAWEKMAVKDPGELKPVLVAGFRVPKWEPLLKGPAVEKGQADFNKLISKSIIPNKPVEITPEPRDKTWGSRAHFSPDLGSTDPATLLPNGTVYLGSAGTRGAASFIHEVLHWLEWNNPAVNKLVANFKDALVKGQRIIPLAKEFPNYGYRDDEEWQPRADGKEWLHHYMGRVAGSWKGWRGGELLTMGAEYYFYKPAELAEKDPELFDFLYRLFHGELTTQPTLPA